MPKKAADPETTQFSITLSNQAVEMIESLVSLGLHGNSRGEVARFLILSRLEDLLAKGLINRPKRKPKD
jgi:Arc/MetJ-type ribon-helix-helix transcriptional regulator